jgi:hypothetical protein
MSSAPSRSAKSDLTAEYLRERLEYDPETGVFTWKWHPDMPYAWNRRWATKIAGSPDAQKYTVIRINNQLYKAHRLAWLYVHSEWPAQDIDHIDHITNNNRLANLRLASKSQNMWNSRPHRNAAHKLKGVMQHSQTGRFYSQIARHRKTYHLGCFDTPEEAHAAYVKAAQQLHGEFANPGTVSTVTTF